MGVCRLALQVLTLFPSNTYKVNAREYHLPPPHLGDFLRRKMNTINYQLCKDKAR